MRLPIDVDLPVFDVIRDHVKIMKGELSKGDYSKGRCKEATLNYLNDLDDTKTKELFDNENSSLLEELKELGFSSDDGGTWFHNEK